MILQEMFYHPSGFVVYQCLESGLFTVAYADGTGSSARDKDGLIPKDYVTLANEKLDKVLDDKEGLIEYQHEKPCYKCGDFRVLKSPSDLFKMHHCFRCSALRAPGRLCWEDLEYDVEEGEIK
jgi:hypothetical protein